MGSNGFFFPQRQQVQESLIGKGFTCSACGRYKGVQTPKMKPFGGFKKEVMILNESPDDTDDKSGHPLQGRRGRSLSRVLKKLNFDLFEDAVIVNAVGCFSDQTKTPTANEITCCRAKVIQEINKYKPKVIILLGDTPLQSLVGKSWKKKIGSVQTWNGYQIPSQEYGAWICPVFAPWFVEYSGDKQGNQAQIFWERDLKDALNCIDKPVPVRDDLSCIQYVFSDEEFRGAIKRINRVSWFSFDYETTGLKPHAPGHQIICTSVAVSETEVYVWENTPYREKAFRMILMKGKIQKSAHNVAFENLWSKVLLNVDVKGWFYCTMNTAHILNNSRGICGLKFQTYVNFGVVGYDDHVATYLESPPKEGANAFNKIKEYVKKFGIKPVLTYCALDSLYGYKLTLKQMEDIANETKAPKTSNPKKEK